MTGLRVLALAAVWCCAKAGGATVGLACNPVAGATSYKFYCGGSPGNYTNAVVAAGPQGAFTNMSANSTYYFAVTAINASGESGYSGEVSARTGALPAKVLVWVQAAAGPSGPWVDTGLSWTNTAAGSNGFWRLRVSK